MLSNPKWTKEDTAQAIIWMGLMVASGASFGVGFWLAVKVLF